MKYQLPEDVKMILDKLKKGGYEAYTVGGGVRDMIIGRETNDWDFTTDAIPEEIIKLFPDGFYDNKFGTVGVPIESSRPKADQPLAEKVIYEITTFRSEQGYTDHRHPDKIEWGKTLEEDLARRDFTINAMAYDGKNIIDPYNGEEDLKNKLIRAVRDPEARFKEDALRIMRAVRIATELGFSIEEKTFLAIAGKA